MCSVVNCYGRFDMIKLPTEHLAGIEPHNSEKDELYEVQKRHSTDDGALKIANGSVER